MPCKPRTLCLLLLLLCCRIAQADQIPASIVETLTAQCADCHHGEHNESDVRFDQLNTMPTSEQLQLLNRVQDQLFYGLMPPSDADPLPPHTETQLVTDLRSYLQEQNASELDEKLPFPAYGNYVSHTQLFTSDDSHHPATAARRWLVSPQVFRERVIDLFELQGNERERFRQTGFYGVTNPVLLPDHSGVRDYAIRTLGGGHLLVMLQNAQWIAGKQIARARLAAGETPDSVFPDQRDRWAPPTTPLEFTAILQSQTPLTDEQINAAVERQFALVLARSPVPHEQEQYHQLMRSAVSAGGNMAGLRQMLVAVILESEFLYRQEIGGGDFDASGRRPLAPSEAAWAISYALGDRRPDAELLAAAASGNLVTAADYARETQRLLNDVNYYRGSVDPGINGGRQSMKSRVTSHPRLIRFFREFFGYPMAMRVFKDSKRSSGVYVNPDRGSTQTPGHLVNEADRVVADIVEADQDVFRKLLTTDRYYLYHDLDNKRGTEQVHGWRTVYEALKDTNWKEDPSGVAESHQDLLRKYVDSRGVEGLSKARHDSSLVRLMTHFENTFGHGRSPFTTFPWAHGNHYWHSPIYSLDATPGRNAEYDAENRFDYATEQPFQISNRRGILTHPAWLVAHSGNFQTDPIRRGRWIREKLLAGTVPEIPITVDAKIPDHADLTLRGRVELVTSERHCQKCHQRMNPLGYPFECFDDFGRYRTSEQLEHPENLVQEGQGNNADVYKSAVLDTSGALSGTDDEDLDGPVQDPFELIERLAQSDRVRQSIIRHAFRFFLGRNETIADSPALIAADRAYLQSNGSFQAVVVSLISSDSFRLRYAPAID